MSIMRNGNIELTEAEAQVCLDLRRLKLSKMAEKFEDMAKDTSSETLTFTERVSSMVKSECDERRTKKINKLIRNAALKYPQAVLDDRLYDPSRELNTHLIETLAKCDWLRDTRNVLITGPTGSGKSYLANALGVLAAGKLMSVRYFRAQNLLESIERCIITAGNAFDLINELSICDLLIIDDFGLMELSVERCMNLFQIIEARDMRRPTIICSQRPVSNWYVLFKDNNYADACLDRLLSGAYRIEMKGASLRG